MKLTTYGMWEEPRLTLVKTLSEVLTSPEQLIDEALLGPVISKIVDTSMEHHQFLQRTSPELSLKERTLAVYEKALSTLLPTLSQCLVGPEEVLQAPVQHFIEQALAFSRQNIDYLMSLAALGIQRKAEAIPKLYGENFAKTYPDLAKKLPFNDPDLFAAAAKDITQAIHQTCPAEIYPRMQAHISY